MAEYIRKIKCVWCNQVNNVSCRVKKCKYCHKPLISEDQKEFQEWISRYFNEKIGRRGVTITKLAMYCGVSRQAMTRYLETGDMPLYIYRKICTTLNVHPDFSKGFCGDNVEVAGGFINAANQLDTTGMLFITSIINDYLAWEKNYILQKKMLGNQSTLKDLLLKEDIFRAANDTKQ